MGARIKKRKPWTRSHQTFRNRLYNGAFAIISYQNVTLPLPRKLPQRLRALTDFLNSLLPATYKIIDTRNSGTNRAVRVRAPGNPVPGQKHRPPCLVSTKEWIPLDSPTLIHVHAHMLLTIKDIYSIIVDLEHLWSLLSS